MSISIKKVALKRGSLFYIVRPEEERKLVIMV